MLILFILLNFAIGFLFGYGCFLAILSQAKQKLPSYIDHMAKSPQVQQQISTMMQEANIEQELELFLEGQVNDFVALIKKQIPMAGSFLQGSLLQKLKDMARGEILQMLPPLKERIEQKVLLSMQKCSWKSIDLPQGLFKKEALLLGLLAGAFGSLLGLLNLFIFIIFGK